MLPACAPSRPACPDPPCWPTRKACVTRPTPTRRPASRPDKAQYLILLERRDRAIRSTPPTCPAPTRSRYDRAPAGSAHGEDVVPAGRQDGRGGGALVDAAAARARSLDVLPPHTTAHEQPRQPAEGHAPHGRDAAARDAGLVLRVAAGAVPGDRPARAGRRGRERLGGVPLVPGPRAARAVAQRAARHARQPGGAARHAAEAARRRPRSAQRHLQGARHGPAAHVPGSPRADADRSARHLAPAAARRTSRPSRRTTRRTRCWRR